MCIRPNIGIFRLQCLIKIDWLIDILTSSRRLRVKPWNLIWVRKGGIFRKSYLKSTKWHVMSHLNSKSFEILCKGRHLVDWLQYILDIHLHSSLGWLEEVRKDVLKTSTSCTKEYMKSFEMFFWGSTFMRICDARMHFEKLIFHGDEKY